MPLELGNPMGWRDQRTNRDIAQMVDRTVIEAPIGHRGLILDPDRVADQFALDCDGFAGKYALGDELVLDRVQRVEQANGEGRTGAETGARRQVAMIMNVEPRLHLQEAKALAHD